MSCSNDITFNEIEWRSHALIADASKAIVQVAAQSKIANRVRLQVLYWQLYQNVRSMATLTNELLNLFHTPDAIAALEAASPEEVETIVRTTSEVHRKVSQILEQVKSPKHWDRLYRPVFDRLSYSNEELFCHSSAFAAKSRKALVLLSKGDQDCLLKALEFPCEPNADLRRAFARTR